MPNHVHALLYFPEMSKSLNTVIGNAKRFLAYEIIKQLEDNKATVRFAGHLTRRSQEKRAQKRTKYTRFLKIVSMQRNVIPKNYFAET